MFKKIIPVALLSSLTVAAGVAFAAEPAYPTNPERYYSAPQVPTARTRAEVNMELQDFRKNPVTADGWQFVGGEREWARIPHSFDFAGGKLTHSDQFDHNQPKPSLSMTRDEKSLANELYRNTI